MKKRTYNKIEHIVDRSIPYLLVLLLFIIAGDLFYSKQLERYSVYIHTLDALIIGVFAVDLVFKYRRARSIPDFLKKHWLEIIAIFPFYLVLRLVEEILLIARISETVSEGQRILHEGVEVTRLTRGEELTRAGRISRIIRPFQRVPRLLEGSKFFEKPVKSKIHRK